MDKTDEVTSSESPASPEDRENKKQPYTSPISLTEDEGDQISVPSFRKGLIPNIPYTLYRQNNSFLEYVLFLFYIVLHL
jgi:hypothetical protein